MVKKNAKERYSNLLEVLPINVDVKVYLKDGISKIIGTDKNMSEWHKLFNWNGSEYTKPCYFLMSLEDLMIPKDSPIPEKLIRGSTETRVHIKVPIEWRILLSL